MAGLSYLGWNVGGGSGAGGRGGGEALKLQETLLRKQNALFLIASEKM